MSHGDTARERVIAELFVAGSLSRREKEVAELAFAAGYAEGLD